MRDPTFEAVVASVPESDVWLHKQVAARLAMLDGDDDFDTYMLAEAAATAARLGDGAAFAAARTWGATLTDRQIERVEDYALVCCDRLEDSLRDLFDADDFEEGGDYHLAACFICIDRDVLEGLTLLLPGAGRLKRALARLDFEGRVTFAAGPHVSPTAYAAEWLERTPQLPDEWWTCPVWPEGAHHWWPS